MRPDAPKTAIVADRAEDDDDALTLEVAIGLEREVKAAAEPMMDAKRRVNFILVSVEMRVALVLC